jgi:hypothetical protein
MNDVRLCIRTLIIAQGNGRLSSTESCCGGKAEDVKKPASCAGSRAFLLPYRPLARKKTYMERLRNAPAISLSEECSLMSSSAGILRTTLSFSELISST